MKSRQLCHRLEYPRAGTTQPNPVIGVLIGQVELRIHIAQWRANRGQIMQ
jgi:hypothetical protein